MPPTKIELFQQEILKGQAAPQDLLALLDVVAEAGDGADPLREALSFSLLRPGRDYPLLSGSYLNERDRQNPDIMANVAAINEILAMVTLDERFSDGRAWLKACGIEISAANWRELSTPSAATQPEKLHRTLHNEKRIAAGPKPVGR